MGCFLGCFGAPKKAKRLKPINGSLPRERTPEHCRPFLPSPTLQTLTTEAADAQKVPELRNKSEQLHFLHVFLLRNKSEQLSIKKKVTFNLNATTYEEAPVYEEPALSVDAEELNEEIIDRKSQKEEGDSTTPSLGTYPVIHRYLNCENSDDENIEEDGEEYDDYDDEEEEEDDGQFKDRDFDGGIVDRGNQEEECFESYFPLQMEKDWEIFKDHSSDKTDSASSPDRRPVLPTKHSARDRSQYIHSVLNPVENLSQWKQVKAKEMPLKHLKKENINLAEPPTLSHSLEPGIKFQKPPFISIPPVKQEVPVDASLSNWLALPMTASARI